jgi:hypothetical protein
MAGNDSSPIAGPSFTATSQQQAMYAAMEQERQKQEADKQAALSGLGVTTTGTATTAASGLPGALGATTQQDLYGIGIQNPFDLSSFQGKLGGLGQQFQGSQAAQMGAAQVAPVGQGDVDKLTGMLFGSASGTSGPTAADIEFQRANNQNMNNALSLAASAPGHGGSYTAALRQAMRQNAATGQEASLGAGQLRAQEQQAAMGQLGSLLPALRGQNIGIASENAVFQQQASAENAQLLEQHGSEIRSRVQALLGAGLTAEQAYNQAILEQKQFNLQSLVQQQGVAKGLAMQAGQSGAQVAGAGLGALGTVAAAAL